MSMDVEPAAGSLGAFVSGVDLTKELSDGEVAELVAALIGTWSCSCRTNR